MPRSAAEEIRKGSGRSRSRPRWRGSCPGSGWWSGAGPCGASSPPCWRARWCCRAATPRWTSCPAFDAAVTAAGYNAVHELLYAGVPSVFVPFERMVDDQEKRAREVAEAGAGLGVRSADARGTDAGGARADEPGHARAPERGGPEEGGAQRCGARGQALLELLA